MEDNEDIALIKKEQNIKIQDSINKKLILK
jgi:hypothetical protein